ncbi:MAG: type VI secretion system-associated protein TagF [Rhodobacteraceae bacterium]|nr:type VI secretion system-associated protein TagF [Paracoccaceae bacterium]
MSAAFGYFGKFPALGDFVRGNTNRRFVEAWDTFLQEGFLASSEALGEGWREAYQTAPIWRFTIGEALIQGGPYYGVMMPSQDAVGRLFPLTLVAQGGPAPLSDGGFFIPVEDAALNMLDSLRGKPELEAMLAALPACCSSIPIAAQESRWLSAPGEAYGAPLGLACEGLPSGRAFNTLLNQDTRDWTGEIITGELA